MSYNLKIKDINFLIDDEDYPRVKKYNWGLHKTRDKYYARTNILMHREIIQAKKGEIVDHIDRNGLNNIKDNLRFCSRAQNNYNKKGSGKTSKYKGVSKRKGYKGWRSAISFNNNNYELGFYNTEKEAAIVYDNKARKLFEEYAYLNFPNIKSTYNYKNSKKIFLSQGEFTIVDNEDFDKLSRNKWCLFRRGDNKYATSCILLHRFIIGIKIPSNMCVDHINRNALDNRKSNLRIVSFSDNEMNKGKPKGNYSSKYKGVSWCCNSKKWFACTRYKNKGITIGYFQNEREAAAAYNNKIKEMFGQFGVLNKL